MNIDKINTISELKRSGYQSKSIRDELRDNMLKNLQNGQNVFSSIIGFDDTVIPDVERAILSRHNILLLGLRGQAKTRIARMLINLLDEHIPVIEGSELNDDPLHPISRFGIDQIREHGDKTPITWMHRSERYVEKLATPDVSVADLIGDVDPIKAATLKLPYSDERVIHFGLVPRAHRSVFVINELPDLQARIQVSLFNILQEGDIQIRGFKLRLPLDIAFVFTANPEDYTNRGSIITPLKDRIESQVLTHYPTTIAEAKQITRQEAQIPDSQVDNIYVPELAKNILERIAFAARESELIDEKSGVSARLTISGYENLLSTSERRALLNKDSQTVVRLIDFWGVIPSITGKVELVYEGEQEGPYNVALDLIGTAVKEEFLEYFPNPDKLTKANDVDIFEDVKAWFSSGKVLDLLSSDSDQKYEKNLNRIHGLKELAKKVSKHDRDQNIAKEFILHALAEFNVITRDLIGSKLSFRDMLANMLDDLDN